MVRGSNQWPRSDLIESERFAPILKHVELFRSCVTLYREVVDGGLEVLA
jgi:hypothetical protein